MKSKDKLILFFIFNFTILTLLYYIPINSKILSNLCLIKRIAGKECWNCGMTRAFLSIIHFDFESAYNYNSKVIIVFPVTIGIYIHSWYKFIFLKRGEKNE